MTPEQKAKAYDEVREKIALRFGSNVAEEIFSEFEMNEDERIRRVIRGWIYTQPASFFDIGFSKEEMLAWLEKQGKSKWSAEDDVNKLFAVSAIKDYYDGDNPLRKELVDWLKSLKDRVQLQNMWKPSKEQIVALRWILNNIPYNKHKEEISGLLDQIKHL